MECQRRSNLIHRRFVAASVLVHALAIFLLPGLRAPSPQPAALAVSLRPVAPLVAKAEPKAAAPARRPANLAPPQPAARPEPPRPTPLSPPAALVRSEPQPTAPTVAASPPPAVIATTVPTPPAADPAAAFAPLVAPAPPKDSPPLAAERRGRPSTLWLANYTQAVSGQVERRKAYPALARARGWQGTTVVAVQLAADGSILSTRIEHSSGHDVLDQQALAMVRLAGPLPPYPERHDGDPLTLQLPIVFALASAR